MADRAPKSLLAALVIGGCTCGAPAASPPSPLEGTPEVAPAPPEVPTRAEPSPADARAAVVRLRAARELAHRGRHAEALVTFAALVREQPGNARLRCEAGYVALEAGRVADAEREIEKALALWPSPPARRDRDPLAMCLYNRGLVAERRGDREAAANAWRRSLVLRPNRTVERRLAALGVAGEVVEEDDASSAGTLEELLARLREELLATGPPELVRVAAPTGGRLAVRVALVTRDPTEPDLDCFEQRVIVSDASGAVVLAGPEAGVCLWNSYFDDHPDLGEPRFETGPPALGQIVAVVAHLWGRGDGVDGRCDVEEHAESTLYLCAERRTWECASVALSESTSCDCGGSGGCDDPDDPSDDGERRPAPWSRSYTLTWELDGDHLVLAPDPGTGAATPPRVGRIPLESLFP